MADFYLLLIAEKEGGRKGGGEKEREGIIRPLPSWGGEGKSGEKKEGKETPAAHSFPRRQKGKGGKKGGPKKSIIALFIVRPRRKKGKKYLKEKRKTPTPLLFPNLAPTREKGKSARLSELPAVGARKKKKISEKKEEKGRGK